jgi:hypothetical protein
VNIDFDHWNEFWELITQGCPNLKDLPSWKVFGHECELCVDGKVMNDRGKQLARLLHS